MNYQIKLVFILVHFSFITFTFAQKETNTTSSKKVSALFNAKSILPIDLNFSINDIKKETNDSTYIASVISYLEQDGAKETLDVQLRVRGNFRLNNCYFPPLKMKIEKDVRKGTLFEENKKIKIVLPCKMQKNGNDYIVKEFMAYQLYEIISPYHFKTRRVDITLKDDTEKNPKTYNLKGIFIEDDEIVAKRHDGKVLERSIHALNQDDLTSVQNAFFQYMIGNTDFSTAIQHNEKLLYVNNMIVPLPYDFDMSGLVNASYSVVSEINGESLPISSVLERYYRGFKRNPEILEQVRNEFIANEDELMQIVNALQSDFEYPKEFERTREYIFKFFDIIKNDKKYQSKIIRNLQTNE